MLTERFSPEQVEGRLRLEYPEDAETQVSDAGVPRDHLPSPVRPRPRLVAAGNRDRAVPGHWEGDLIIGSTSTRSAIGTLVERTSGFVMLLHLPENHTALTVSTAMIEAMNTLPDQLRRSVTWDQGREMAKHQEITMATGMSIYHVRMPPAKR